MLRRGRTKTKSSRIAAPREEARLGPRAGAARAAVATVLVLAASGPALAGAPGADAAAPPLTLEQAVAGALASHPRAAASAADRALAEAGADRALARLLPRIDFREAYVHSNDPVYVFGTLLRQERFTEESFQLDRLNDPDGLDDFETVLRAEVPLVSVPAIAERRRALATVESAAAGEDAVREALALHTVEAFWRLALARDAVAVVEDVHRAAAANADRARAAARAGTALLADALSAEVRLGEVEGALAEARGTEVVARLALEALVGAPVERIAVPPEPAAADEGLEPLDALLAAADVGRADLAALTSAAEAARHADTAARARWLPTLGVEAAQRWDHAHPVSDGSSSYYVGVGLDWNLFAGGGDAAAVREAAAALRKAEAELAARRREVRLEVASARARLEAARARLAAATGGAAEAAEAQRIVARRYEEGLETWTQLVTGEAALAGARLREVEAAAAVRTARARLDHAVGRLVGRARGDGS